MSAPDLTALIDKLEAERVEALAEIERLSACLKQAMADIGSERERHMNGRAACGWLTSEIARLEGRLADARAEIDRFRQAFDRQAVDNVNLRTLLMEAKPYVMTAARDYDNTEMNASATYAAAIKASELESDLAAADRRIRELRVGSDLGDMIIAQHKSRVTALEKALEEASIMLDRHGALTTACRCRAALGAKP